jgi:hypothetical protein
VIHPFDCFCPVCRGECDDPNVVRSYRAPDSHRSEFEDDQQIAYDVRRQSEQYDTYKEDSMKSAPKPAGTEKQAPAKSIRKAPEPSGNSGGGTFLRAADIGDRVGSSGVIAFLGKDAQEAPAGSFSDIFIPVSVKGKEYLMGLKFQSPNYRRLYARFGSNFNQWKGKVEVEVGKHMGNNYIMVVD